MPSPLIRKLENFTKLSDEQRSAIEHAVTEVVDFGPREDIISEGEKPDHISSSDRGMGRSLQASARRPVFPRLILVKPGRISGELQNAAAKRCSLAEPPASYWRAGHHRQETSSWASNERNWALKSSSAANAFLKLTRN